ncbi:MAG: A/G-specific adenine glycosylase [Demequinaceae bacterium]|nr:A/G-specific adenine glycosylase [Demequinaceae bacterium]
MPPASEVPNRDTDTVRRVVRWFEGNGRTLPWREAADHAWGVLVSEVMLQQTPVARVLPLWREWMARWPSPEALAGASPAEAVRAWGRLGYPRRALRLRECAAAIVRDHQGQVPCEESVLRALPGLGDYTAAAVVSFAFGTRTAVLDTNVRRVIARVWGGEALPPGHTTRAERVRALALVPDDPKESVRWNIGAMELGALVCLSRNPRCDECPIQDRCAWLDAGRPGLGVRTTPRQPWHGSDRQVRGRILALLREASAPINLTEHASLENVDPGQLDRCLESLVADGLARLVSAEQGTFGL